MYYPNPTEYKRISREILRWKPTVYIGTPTFVNGVLQAALADRSKADVVPQFDGAKASKVLPSDSQPWPTASLRLCITGAEKTPDDLFQLASDHTPPLEIIEGYGITETSPILTVNRPGQPRGGVGQAIRNITLGLLEEEGYLNKDFKMLAKCEAGEVTGPKNKRGVIIASGPTVFGAPEADPPRAYLGIPLSEKNPFVELEGKWWYDTGDLGFFDETGALHLAGRLKRFVKIAGEMVSLVALEAALKERKPWADGEAGPVVAVEACEVDGERPVLALVSAVDASLEDANDQLKAAGMPKIAKLTVAVDARTTFDERWAQQGSLPLLGTGKTDYAQIKRAVVAAVQAQ